MKAMRIGGWMLVWSLAAAVAAAEPEGYELPLLDSGQLATGWTACGNVAIHEDGTLALPAEARLRTQHRCRDFLLEFQWQLGAGEAAGGLSFGCGAAAGCRAEEPGWSINLATGEANRSDAAGDPPQPLEPGRWHAARLRVTGGVAELELNGQGRGKIKGDDGRTERLEFRGGPAGSPPLLLRHVRLVELGHRSLFNGTDLSGWEGGGGEAEQCWAVRDRLLLCTGEKGPWLRSAEQFADFNLRLEYRLNAGGNSGIYIRVPPSGNHHGAGAGIEVQLLDDAAERYRNLKPYQFTGSLYAIVPAEPRVSRPAGCWNTLEIDACGTSYRVVHNGCDVIAADGEQFPELAERLVEGHLGLQNHNEEVYFRRLRIGPSLASGKPAEPPCTQAVRLFNGRDLEGWAVKCRPADRDKTYWKVEDGAITAEAPAGSDHDYIWLLTEREFADFDLKLKVQTFSSSTGNSGVQVRSRYDDQAGWLDGPQVDIHPPGPWRSGFIYDETREARIWLWPDVGQPANARPEHAPEGWTWEHADQEDRWNDVQIICRGTQITTIINGVTVADYDGRGRLDDPAHRARNVGLKGHVGLQIHPGGQLRIRFKDLELQEFCQPPGSGT